MSQFNFRFQEMTASAQRRKRSPTHLSTLHIPGPSPGSRGGKPANICPGNITALMQASHYQHNITRIYDVIVKLIATEMTESYGLLWERMTKYVIDSSLVYP